MTSREDYPDDVSRIVVALTWAGYPISRAEASAAWDAYSASVCASWIMLDEYSAAGIVNVVTQYWTPTGWVFPEAS